MSYLCEHGCCHAPSEHDNEGCTICREVIVTNGTAETVTYCDWKREHFQTPGDREWHDEGAPPPGEAMAIHKCPECGAACIDGLGVGPPKGCKDHATIAGFINKEIAP